MMFHSFPEVLGENVRLRPLVHRDREDVFKLFSDPKVMQLDTGPRMRTTDEAEQYIETFSSLHAIMSLSTIRWAIEETKKGRFIGTAGFKQWSRYHKQAEVGGSFLKAYSGYGYGTETLRLLVLFGFKQLFLERLHAYTLEENIGAIRVLEKCAFHHEGTLRHFYKKGDTFQDVRVYALLNGDDWHINENI